jgi:hemerythrin-like domain-containing protein
MTEDDRNRRYFLKVTALAGSALILQACGNNATTNVVNAKQSPEKNTGSDEEAEEVTPLEDLMREHGVLRRALFVFSEAAAVLPHDPQGVWADAIQKAAKLFREFGEDYHEKKLEEQFIFPLIKQKAPTGPAGSYPDILTAQHARGREITDYILASTAAGKIGANSTGLSKALNGFVRMYDAHAAREDTIVFPAWKDLIKPDEYAELGEKFEDIEHEQFGEDGYENAVKQIAAIETSVGLDDISKLTPAGPPK